MDPISDFLNNLLNQMFNGIIETIWGAFDAVWQSIYDTFVTWFPWFEQITDFFARLIEDVGRIFSEIVDFFRPVFDFIVWLVETVNRIVILIIQAFQLVVSLLSLGLSWLFQIIGVLVGTLLGLTGAPILPVPGLPRCITAPTDWELCAVWYVTDNTVFADATPGELLIPVVVLLIDLWIIFYAGRQVFRLARKIGGVFNAA